MKKGQQTKQNTRLSWQFATWPLPIGLKQCSVSHEMGMVSVFWVGGKRVLSGNQAMAGARIPGAWNS